MVKTLNERMSIDEDYICDAFPSGIPDNILSSRLDHRQPYSDDSGIRF